MLLAWANRLTNDPFNVWHCQHERCVAEGGGAPLHACVNLEGSGNSNSRISRQGRGSCPPCSSSWVALGGHPLIPVRSAACTELQLQ